MKWKDILKNISITSQRGKTKDIRLPPKEEEDELPPEEEGEEVGRCNGCIPDYSGKQEEADDDRKRKEHESLILPELWGRNRRFSQFLHELRD